MSDRKAALDMALKQIEMGFIADGELLSGAVGAAGLAVALTAITPMNPRRLYVAGSIGGIAISLKQSGFDAILTGVVVVAATAVLRHDRLRGLAALLVGIATVLGAMAVYGALTSWDRFWYAFVGLSHRGAQHREPTRTSTGSGSRGRSRRRSSSPRSPRPSPA